MKNIIKKLVKIYCLGENNEKLNQKNKQFGQSQVVYRYQNKYIILEKLEGTFRQDLPIGNTEIQGYCRHGIEVGKPIDLFSHPIKGVRPDCWTSIVKEIDGDIIKTQNSTYKITIKQKCSEQE